MPSPSSQTINLTLERCSWNHTVHETVRTTVIQNDSFYTVQAPYNIQGVRISKSTREELIPASQRYKSTGYWRIRKLIRT